MDFLRFFSKEKRKGLPDDSSLSESKRPRVGSKKIAIRSAKVPLELSIAYESPPLVFHGNANSSTGAILSGLLELKVTQPETRVEMLEVELLGITTTKVPWFKNCPDCKRITTSLHKWEFLSRPSNFKMGKLSFPFSYLLPGHLPSTSHGSLGSIDYMLSAHAKTSSRQSVKFTRTLTVWRALKPRDDRINLQSVGPRRIWVKLMYPEIIHPIGLFSVQLRLTGVVRRRDKYRTRFVVQKLSWRIDEHCIIVSSACRKHNHKLGGGSQKGGFHHDKTLIGMGAIKDGWKNDFVVPGGQVDLNFRASINPGSQYVCDVKSATGFQVKHTFTLEIIVAEYHVMDTDPKHPVSTGQMYMLKTISKQMLTDRGGMGIAWDEEHPPIYRDVSFSPPGYTAEYSQRESVARKNLQRTSNTGLDLRF